MEVTKVLLDSEHPTRILYFDKHGNSEVKAYPPTLPADIAIVEKFGGHHEISRATYQHSEEINRELNAFKKFRESRINFTESYAINSLMAYALSKEDLMKLKLTIFDHEFVKNSKNREILTNIRKSDDPVDLIMYFGMIRKEANVENEE